MRILINLCALVACSLAATRGKISFALPIHFQPKIYD